MVILRILPPAPMFPLIQHRLIFEVEDHLVYISYLLDKATEVGVE